MRLTVGIFLKLLIICSDKKNGDVVRSVFRGLLGSEWVNYDGTFTDKKVSRILSCKDHLSGYGELIKKQLETAKYDDYIKALWGEMYSILCEDKIDLFLHALRNLEMHDSYLVRTEFISLCRNKQVDRRQLDFRNHRDEYVPCMLLYAVLYTDNGEGASFVKEITPEYVSRFQRTLSMGPMASSVINGLAIEDKHLTDIVDNLAFQGLSGRMGRHKLMSLANRGNPFACFEIGEMYYHGYIRLHENDSNGKTKDFPEAYRWYKKAVDLGNHPAAWWTIGYMRLENRYPHVEETSIDYGEVLRCFKAAGDESPAALNSIGVLWETGHYPMDDFEKTGLCYPANLETAHDYFNRAAEKGYHYAANHLGRWHENKGDYATAHLWYKRSIEMVEDSYAYNKLGLFHEQGLGCQRDVALACDFYLRSINNVLLDDITPWAQYNAGRVYTGYVSDYATGYYDLGKAWQLFISAMRGLKTEEHDQMLITMLTTLLREYLVIAPNLLDNLYNQTIVWLNNYIRCLPNSKKAESKISEMKSLWSELEQIIKSSQRLDVNNELGQTKYT